MENFTPISAFIGGILIGLASALLMALHGRIAGISGILGGLLTSNNNDWNWRIAFVAGLIIAPVVYLFVTGTVAAIELTTSPITLIIAGLLVGFGTRLGSGCTSGHGVCGMARLSLRSMVATVVFVLTAILTVFISRHIVGV